MARATQTAMDASSYNEQAETPLALMRTIKDPIHDYITFPAYIWSFIDTRQFQRLRAIKQLGVSYYVWAGASHNRFEHCIGVAHLAGLLVERLRMNQPELGITDRDVRCVQLAGLCHDLGHGPWSHLWDSHFIPAVLPDQAWTHEDASEMMFDDLVKKNSIPIDQDDVNFIRDLIKGTVRHSAGKNPSEKKFLFDIVANKRNGIDVDKFDYIARDVRAIGDHNNFSATRLIDSARVINDEICYHIKDANSVYELCSLRFSNHKRIYSHKTARAIEHMIVDALKVAEPTMRIAKLILDPDKYVYLTDNVLERIEMSDDPALQESQEIIDRIRRRDLYRRVDVNMFPYDMLSSLKENVTPERIVHAAKLLFLPAKTGPERPNEELVTSLSPDHVVIDFSTLHYGMKEKNPIDSVRFYGKHNIKDAFKAEPGELSTLMPASFAEIQLQVYTKDPVYWGLIQAGYRELVVQLQDDTTPPYLNLAGSPSPTTTEPPATPRIHASASPPPGGRTRIFARTPSLNKFTRVDPSFAPPSPSLRARRGPSVPPFGSREVQRTHRARGSVDVMPDPEKPRGALVVQDSLASVVIEANGKAGTLESEQASSHAEEHGEPELQTPRAMKAKPRMFSPALSVDLDVPESSCRTATSTTLDKPTQSEPEQIAMDTEGSGEPRPSILTRSDLPKTDNKQPLRTGSSSRGARRRRPFDGDAVEEASAGRSRLKRRKP